MKLPPTFLDPSREGLDVGRWKQDGGQDAGIEEAPWYSGLFVHVDYNSGSDEDPTGDVSALLLLDIRSLCLPPAAVES